ncbi:MAG: sugar transferase [Desulfobacteraceae bacterium]|nr:MAG: sugar transferase [Desulfobacteraceae bacterium]
MTSFSRSLAVKRCCDIMGAMAGIMLSAPVMCIIGGLIGWKMGLPVFFKQSRPGRLTKPFHLFKFRTMTGQPDPQSRCLPDEQRLTRLGKHLRASSLDELPELFNVIKGDMSLVGPRPLLMQYLKRYTPEQMRRHEMKPGLTGWAQVNGRNAIGWEERFKLDVWYVDHWSLWLDVKIILLTMKQIIRREGINHPGEATMSEFNPVRHGCLTLRASRKG